MATAVLLSTDRKTSFGFLGRFPAVRQSTHVYYFTVVVVLSSVLWCVLGVQRCAAAALLNVMCDPKITTPQFYREYVCCMVC
jgi:hypothetical protein